MDRALEPVMSLLAEGRHAEAAEVLASYLGAAVRRGRPSIELPFAGLGAPLTEGLEGLGIELRPVDVDGKPSLEMRLRSGP